MADHPRLVELVRLPNRMEAEILVAQLGSQGVKALVVPSGAAIVGAAALIMPTRVLVAEEDHALALEMTEELLGPQ